MYIYVPVDDRYHWTLITANSPEEAEAKYKSYVAILLRVGPRSKRIAASLRPRVEMKRFPFLHTKIPSDHKFGPSIDTVEIQLNYEAI